jgi:cytochrome d ubiquinol oxidase subunit II
MSIDLTMIWAGIISFAVIMYVVMDGFDLGIGILFPFFRAKSERDTMMNSVAPVWDGNETWLVLGGGGLLAAFPLAYAVILSALYVPLMLMLIALIFRGVAFEFRFKSQRLLPVWDAGFAAGSVIAALMQGAALGALIDGIHVEGRMYAGGPFDWLTPFALFTGIALVAGYAMLGCGWLIMKTEGTLQDRMFHLMPVLAGLVVFAIIVVSLWTPSTHPLVAERWFTLPNLIYLSPVPVLVALIAGAMVQVVRHRAERTPFLLALALFVLSYAGLAISLWPYVVPPSITIWDAAAVPEAQSVLLIGVILLLPVILGYTAYSYWVFRGKVTDAGYHA